MKGSVGSSPSKQTGIRLNLCELTQAFSTTIHTRLHGKFGIVLISGYTAVGKTTLARSLRGSFENSAVVSTDSFMLDRASRNTLGRIGDDPECIEFTKLIQTVGDIYEGKKPYIPIYNHITGKHDSTEQCMTPTVLIIEGTSALYPQLVLPYPTISIFLDTDTETGVRLLHETYTSDRKNSEESFRTMLPLQTEANRRFIEPSKHRADYICSVYSDRRYSPPRRNTNASHPQQEHQHR